MNALLKIAARNLVEHKTKSIIVGTLIALGIAVLIVGNAVLDSTEQGSREFFIESYTGHVMISGNTDGNASIFGLQVNTGNEELRTIPNYSEVWEHATSQSQVVDHTAQVTSYGIANYDEEQVTFFQLFGIEPGTYWDMFGNIEVIDGRMLEPGEEGIMIQEHALEDFEEYAEVTITPGDEIQLQAAGMAGFRIRNVPVVGIFEFTYENPLMENLAYVDVQTLRALNNMVVGSTQEIELTEEETQFLGTDDVSSLFSGGDDMLESAEAAETADPGRFELPEATEAGRRARQVDSGAWHFLLLRLENLDQVEPFIAEMNQWFNENEIHAMAYSWDKASGMQSFLDIIRAVFNGAIIIIAIVAVIVIMNTLVVSVIERTSEIGTMRALGAQKGFVRRLFLMETLTISVVFGVIGIILGWGILGLLNLIRIEATNPFMTIIFGGPVLAPAITLSPVITAAFIILFVGLISSLYPVAVALKVDPIKAIQAE
ncbi:MAG: ABC transporter permease [Spirochaetia bacterium]